MKHNEEYSEWYDELNKSSWTPSTEIFNIIWTFMYLSMFVSQYLVRYHTKCYPFCTPVFIFFISILLHIIWTTIFYTYKQIGLALLDICIMFGLVSVSAVKFYNIDKTAAYLLIPYLCWLCFTIYLNAYIYLHN